MFSRQHYKLIIAAVVVGLTFFISTPYMFLDYQHSVPNLIGAFNIRYTSLSCIYSQPNESQMFFYARQAFYNFGAIFTILGLAGIGMKINPIATRKIAKGDLLLLSWIVPFAVIFNISKLKLIHYFLIISPFLMIFFANAICEFEKRFNEKFAWGKYAALSIALLIPLQPLYYSVKNNIILTRQDTRELAHDWIIKNIPKESIIAKELLWTPFLPKDRYKIVYNGWSLGDNEMDWYKKRNVEYFLVSQDMKDLMSHPDRPSSLHRQFYKDLEKEASIIHIVEGNLRGPFMDFHNPTVLVYSLDTNF